MTREDNADITNNDGATSSCHQGQLTLITRTRLHRSKSPSSQKQQPLVTTEWGNRRSAGPEAEDENQRALSAPSLGATHVGSR